jgi:inward rectifier potassium channel
VRRRPGRRRLVFGTGTPFVAVGLPSRPLGDAYHQLITWSWSRTLGALAATYLVLNTLFALGYLACGPGAIANARPGSLQDAWFFAFETMATIGYGQMYPVGLAANLLTVAQALLGLGGLAVATGLLFAKFARPTARVLFSEVAVVTTFDGVPSLLFRMANARANQIAEAQLSVVLLVDETTAEGTEVRRAHDLALVRDRSLVFSLTWLAVHPITPESPLHGATPESLAAGDAVVVASVSGIDEHLGQTVHARNAWPATAIRFGHRFVDVFLEDADGTSLVDYTRFHEVVAEGAPPAPAQAAPAPAPAPAAVEAAAPPRP